MSFTEFERYVHSVNKLSSLYSLYQKGNSQWTGLEAPDAVLYPWDAKSTYIKSPPFFETMVSINSKRDSVWREKKLVIPMYPKLWKIVFYHLSTLGFSSPLQLYSELNF